MSDYSNEIWKDVPRYEGIYQVSSLGRVKAISRRKVSYGGRVWMTKEIIMKQQVTKIGYAMIMLQTKGVENNYRTNRLVLEAFVGPCPKGMESRHLDGNRLNNRLDNLCWGTHVENCKDRTFHGKGSQGIRNPKAKISDLEVKVIRELYDSGHYGSGQLAKMFDVDRTTIHSVVSRKTWRHIA